MCDTNTRVVQAAPGTVARRAPRRRVQDQAGVAMWGSIRGSAPTVACTGAVGARRRIVSDEAFVAMCDTRTGPEALGRRRPPGGAAQGVRVHTSGPFVTLSGTSNIRSSAKK
jgi:hypothetical protein